MHSDEMIKMIDYCMENETGSGVKFHTLSLPIPCRGICEFLW